MPTTTTAAAGRTERGAGLMLSTDCLAMLFILSASVTALVGLEVGAPVGMSVGVMVGDGVGGTGVGGERGRSVSWPLRPSSDRLAQRAAVCE
jgi:hypothetical protein